MVEQTSLVKLSVFDILGRNVKAILDETRQPGKYSLTTNVGDMSSGTYFLRLARNEHTIDRKFVVLK
jgi:hypothetical protein